MIKLFLMAITVLLSATAFCSDFTGNPAFQNIPLNSKVNFEKEMFLPANSGSVLLGEKTYNVVRSYCDGEGPCFSEPSTASPSCWVVYNASANNRVITDGSSFVVESVDKILLSGSEILQLKSETTGSRLGLECRDGINAKGQVYLAKILNAAGVSIKFSKSENF